MYPPITSYALIGDGRSAALIGQDGGLDWLCLPRFDSPWFFGALLDRTVGGTFCIRPREAFHSVRRYVPDTNVLETTFTTERGTCILRDLMPVTSEEDKRGRLLPDHQVLRDVEGIEGEVELEVLFAPRPDHARHRPRLTRRGALGIWCQDARGTLLLQSEIPLAVAADLSSAYGVERITAGEHRYISLCYSREGPTVIPALGETSAHRVAQSIKWWRAWAARCTYQGPYRDCVVRSALALKLMAYAPSGAIVAAPTTSLPEQPGGPRNWDYRYCWLRDAAFAVRAIFALGYDEEAIAFLDWLLHSTRLTWPELRVLYDVFGNAPPGESVLLHLEGYAHARPVRVGNAAKSQFQLDVYGEVVDAAALFAQRRGRFDRQTARLLIGFGKTVCRRWRETDDGIWEIRSGRRHHTHSKVMGWVALDRLIAMHDGGVLTIPSINARLHSYTSTFDGDDLDASLLTLPLVHYVAADDPRMRGTFERIRQRLARGSLIYRYDAETDDGLPPGEGAFGVCSFWAVECLAREGKLEAARHAFDDLLTYANDVGLFAEEIDPPSRAALGNFPQAFTHMGLINAALTLQECEAQAGSQQPDAWRHHVPGPPLDAPTRTLGQPINGKVREHATADAGRSAHGGEER
jgi:GH15 family glucan-1,4-alpha-glucosidase